MSPTVTELLPGFGARVADIDILADESFGTITDLWHKHQVLVFPGLDLTTEQQIQFASRFGDLEQLHKIDPNAESEYVLYVSNRPEEGQRQTATPDGELAFHMDQSYLAAPSKATFLYGLAVPSEGGSTLFGSMIRAYKALPEDLRLRLQGLNALHADFGIECVHPLVVRHPETGQDILYYGRSVTDRIIGIGDRESDTLVDELLSYLEDERFVYRHNWTVGDLVMWDNRSVLHARTNFNPTEARILRRVTVRGEKLEAGGLAA
jgi:taurine dioxygenase